jgi:hypothetical protein
MAHGLFNALPPGEVESQQVGGQCGVDLVDVACFASQNYDEPLTLAWDVKIKCAALSDDIIDDGCHFMYLRPILHFPERS